MLLSPPSSKDLSLAFFVAVITWSSFFRLILRSSSCVGRSLETFKRGSVVCQTGVFSETVLIAKVINIRLDLRGVKLVYGGTSLFFKSDIDFRIKC